MKLNITMSNEEFAKTFLEGLQAKFPGCDIQGVTFPQGNLWVEMPTTTQHAGAPTVKTPSYRMTLNGYGQESILVEKE